MSAHVVGQHHLGFGLGTIALAIALFLAGLAFLEIGRRIGIHQLAKHGQGAMSGVGKADSAVFALFALLVGFAFSGAAARFDHRREIIAGQVNAISTGWMRVDALSRASQPPVRAAFRNYVDAVIAAYAGEHGAKGVWTESPVVARAQEQLWSDALAACLAPDGEHARMLLLPSLNEIFAASDSERLARWIHPPTLIYVMLGIAGLASALFAGYGLAAAPTRSWLYMLGIAATMSVAVFVTVELEYPRRGLIRIDQMDQALTELRASMK